jgi:hypothetical protein
MNINNGIQLYHKLLPDVLYTTCVVTCCIGLAKITNKYDPVKSLIETIGFGSIGFGIGITYPVSFPLIGCYYLLTKNNNTNNLNQSNPNQPNNF